MRFEKTEDRHDDFDTRLPGRPSGRRLAMRVAIYFTPPAGAELTRRAGEWLGRSPFDNEPTRAPDEALDAVVAEPARYGFHATIKAPFRLAEGADLAELDERLAAFCASREPVRIQSLVVSQLGPFFAFVPDAAPAALGELEEAVVRDFEPLRAPLSEAEYARRRPERLSDKERDNLQAWGYPHVFDAFRFHMTLTGPVEERELAAVRERIAAHFGDLDGQPLTISQLALFLEPEPGEPFRTYSVHPFRPDV
ncbi:DUF1045 domain-containing protein [Aurantimonas sp. VKM B-3413]|uniref:DUF1045 domain-containing protein n=1 Tax=Aurantimonas sp. VKM B-3413 TaxID=2779401 RepID=UPI001E54246F|nr:DUF1045 domain-containing protein [Aurantimonas sp. VKM B-3413]MCB8838794.1 DUF1045 domain-containing protein [Aurantimonas sp. VKM B-3413]